MTAAVATAAGMARNRAEEGSLAGHSVLQISGLTLDASLAARPVEILRDLSLEIQAGHTLGLVGESGAGKSMVGRLISGLTPPGFRVSKGSLFFEGADLLRQPVRQRRALLGRRIAFIPQEPLSALNPVLTVESQFAEHLARLQVDRAQRRHCALDWLAAVHLPDPASIMRRFPHELSGGQCQRVLIAMAFASKPALIVADEPTTALDVVTQARIIELLQEQQERHRAAVLLITHDLHLAAQICHEVGVLYAGDLVEKGPASSVLGNPAHPYSRALKGSTPPISGPRRLLSTLPDVMPGVLAFGGLPGCRFAPRCPISDDRCAAQLPAWRTASEQGGPGHKVRCTMLCGAQAQASAPLPAWRAASPSSPGVPILQLEHVDLVYRRRTGWRGWQEVEAVRDVSLSVGAGEFVGIVGESGSGKSSLARLIMGLERPSAGGVLIDGMSTREARTSSAAAALRREIQLVFQDPQAALNPRRSVFRLVTQALEAPAASARKSAIPANRRRRAAELLAETGLPPDCLPRMPSQLSGGQKQRVNIARALCVTPRLLVADEIVSGLDVSVQAQILNLLLRLGEELGISLLFISHDLGAVRYLCSRVLVMCRGEVVEEGATDTLFAAPRHPYTRSLLAAAAGNGRSAAAVERA